MPYVSRFLYPAAILRGDLDLRVLGWQTLEVVNLYHYETDH